MCGVFGYIGEKTSVVPMVASALRVMEYRGYDSWGIGWADGPAVELLKKTGRVPKELLHDATASIAIGHTRWATHGEVTDANAHPHTDSLQQIAVVHNGVIENASELKSGFLSHITFQSDTDSEIIPHLIRLYLSQGATFTGAVRSTFMMLDGSSAIVAMDRTSEMIVAVTSRSPLRLGRRADGWELASDPLACAHSSQEIAVVPDNHLLLLTRNSAQLIDIDSGSECSIPWEPTPEEVLTSRGSFPHFTLKEIHDQVDVLRRLSVCGREASDLADAVRSHRHILLTGCGSALYAATLGSQLLAKDTRSWIDVVPASEMDEHTRNLGSGTLVIALTQSGETADVVDAMQKARKWGATVATIINTESSTIARMADIVLPIYAGVERSVLATKSFLAMAIRMYQVAALLRNESTSVNPDIIAAIESVLKNSGIAQIAEHLSQAQTMIVLGKGIGSSVAKEAALKIKEGSYLHAESFLMGELKHGPLALVASGTPCLIFATTSEELSAARIAAAEVASRGGYVVGIGSFAPGDCSAVIEIDHQGGISSFIHLVAAQSLAYHIAIARGVDPDFPRNLAKSVTVR